MYVKICHLGTTYGPFKAPITLKSVCMILGVSLTACPCLASLDRQKQLIIVNLDSNIDNGYYELLAKPEDDHLNVHEQIIPPVQIVPHCSIDQQVVLPLDDREMKIALKAMMDLISSIPSRYVKYNTRLSAQIDNAIVHVDQWSTRISQISKQDPDYNDHVTFIQYRMLNILYETWKTVWTQFSPYSRSFSNETIFKSNTLDSAEHYLNLLCSWRRMLPQSLWAKIKSKYQPKTSKQTQNILKPPRLPSTEEGRSFTYLVSRKEKDSSSVIDRFRRKFIKELVLQNLFHTGDLERLLDNLLKEEHQNLNFPHNRIKSIISKEFDLFH